MKRVSEWKRARKGRGERGGGGSKCVENEEERGVRKIYYSRKHTKRPELQK